MSIDRLNVSGADEDFRLPKDPRRLARQATLQFLHQLAVQRGASMDQLEAFLNEHCRQDKAKRLAREWIRGAWHDLDAIDKEIERSSNNWDMYRLSEVDRANLRLAVYQMFHCADIPFKVVINEAIELASEFSTVQAGAFINGVLDAVARRLNQQMEA